MAGQAGVQGAVVEARHAGAAVGSQNPIGSGVAGQAVGAGGACGAGEAGHVAGCA